MTTIRVVELHCTAGTSDKLYRMTLVETAPGNFTVQAENCRRGASWVHQPNRATGATLWQAEEVIRKTIEEKERKGYRVIKDQTLSKPGGSATPASAAAATPKTAPSAPKAPSPKFGGVPAATGAVPASAAPASDAAVPFVKLDTDSLTPLLTDPGFVLHEVKGGIPMRIGVEGGLVKGVVGSLPAAVQRALVALGDGFEIEGELVGAVFHAWDIRKLNGQALDDMTRSERYFELTYLLCKEETSEHIKTVFHDDSPDKVPFFFLLQDEGAAGVQLLSDAALASEESKPRRYTFCKDSLFIVLGKCGDGRTLELGLHPINKGDNFHRLPVEWRGLPVESTVPVGFVEVGLGQAIPKIGAVVRVSYESIGGHGGKPIKGATFLGVEDRADEEAAHMGQIRL